MKHTKYKGIFIDDNKDDLSIYKDIISDQKSNEFCIEIVTLDLIESVAKMSTQISELNPDLVLLDYRLDEELSSYELDNSQGYRGGTLAQHLREQTINNPDFLDFPIILLSSEDNIEKLYKPDQTSHDLFDCCYSKQEVSEDFTLDSNKIFDKFIGLIQGYKALNEVRKENSEILSVFDISNEASIREVVEQQEIKTPLVKASASHVIAQFILKNIIRREGILYSNQELAAKLGLYEESLTKELFNWLAKHGCRYEGIFSHGWQRWWAHKVDQLIENNIDARAFNMTSQERVKKLNEVSGFTFEPAQSAYTGTVDEKLFFACCACGRPTEMRHSLGVYDSATPRFVQKKRICWACIRDDVHDRKHIEIEENDKKFIRKIQNNTL